VIQRWLLVAASLAVAVLAGLWLHSARLESQAQAIAERPSQTLTKGEADRAVRLFESARANNPDTRPVEREAGLLIRNGRPRQAVTLLQPIVKREPQDLTAWVLIAIGARGADPALEREALARVGALNPLSVRAR
jgi:predicted Zn-dependent protease